MSCPFFALESKQLRIRILYFDGVVYLSIDLQNVT